jgi:nucleoside-diphosphate-sugar epimerase
MRALVTGGNGFLGGHIVGALREQGAQVVVLARRPPSGPAVDSVQTLCGDITDPAAVMYACKDIDTVFHVASQVGSWGDPRDFHMTNVVGTRNVIKACIETGVAKLIYTSTPSVVFGARPIHAGTEALPYPQRYLSDYQRTKALAEQDVLRANGMNGLSTTSLRPHAIWGAGDRHLLPRLLSAAAQGRLKIIGDGANCISMTHVRNAASAHVQAAASNNTGGKAYFVNDPEPVNLWSWINEVVTALDLPPVTGKIPYRAAYAAGAFLEFVHCSLHLQTEPAVTRYVASLLATEHTFDIGNAIRDFGYAPVVGRAHGTTELIQYFRRQLKRPGEECLHAVYS